MVEHKKYDFARMQQNFNTALAGLKHDFSVAREEGDCDWLGSLIDDAFSINTQLGEAIVLGQIDAAIKNEEYGAVEFMVYKCLEHDKKQLVSVIIGNTLKDEEFKVLPSIVGTVFEEGHSNLVLDQFNGFKDAVQEKRMSVDACAKTGVIFYLGALDNNLPSDLSGDIWNEMEHLFSNSLRGEMSQVILSSLYENGDTENYQKALVEMKIAVKPDISLVAPE